MEFRAGTFMQRIEDLAFISVGRGCGFAALGIATFMFGMSGDFVLALQTGGILGLVVCFILLMRAARAPQNPYKRTEVWMMLAAADRPPEALAQSLVGSALKRSYQRFALQFALGSSILLGGSVIVRMIQAMAS